MYKYFKPQRGLNLRCFSDSFQSLRFSVPTANNETRRPRFRSEAKVRGGGGGGFEGFWGDHMVSRGNRGGSVGINRV